MSALARGLSLTRCRSRMVPSGRMVLTIDPVGSGLVASLAHPGGNTTGFTAFEFSLNAELLERSRRSRPA
jgi:hypothetical protein